ncbi:sirohydrochlorin cobaltochelatase [Sphaerotilus hippei]|uniref:Sirohydrochlorin cobaltochelatase n=1 Tax=Sphaerotilus hippei TaxID=744406 RepID=A0A318GXT8_9BURK|nr:CbiX/SirB N-terminal domain-containing protein [Sphaerotilus hippei]PXW94744.1 sirohydrochlorin cobaltochelatase [Sphaerotilus hippei]
MHGILLFAHGARDPQWARPFHRIADQLRAAAPDQPVALAFLELMTPGLAAGVDELVAQGCRHVTVVPLFLGAGGHVRKDLPVLIEQARAAWPDVHIEATAAIGEIDGVTRALAHATLELVRAPAASTGLPS